MDLETLIKLAHEVAKPWRISTYILATLLIVSILGNIYLATKENTLIFEADNNSENAAEWSISQNKG